MNVSVERNCLRSAGSLFHTRGAATRRGDTKNIFCYISPICSEALSGWICITFGIGGPLVDVINCADFFVDQFRGIDFVGGG